MNVLWFQYCSFTFTESTAFTILKWFNFLISQFISSLNWRVLASCSSFIRQPFPFHNQFTCPFLYVCQVCYLLLERWSPQLKCSKSRSSDFLNSSKTLPSVWVLTPFLMIAHILLGFSGFLLHFEPVISEICHWQLKGLSVSVKASFKLSIMKIQFRSPPPPRSMLLHFYAEVCLVLFPLSVNFLQGFLELNCWHGIWECILISQRARVGHSIFQQDICSLFSFPSLTEETILLGFVYVKILVNVK